MVNRQSSRTALVEVSRLTSFSYLRFDSSDAQEQTSTSTSRIVFAASKAVRFVQCIASTSLNVDLSSLLQKARSCSVQNSELPSVVGKLLHSFWWFFGYSQRSCLRSVALCFTRCTKRRRRSNNGDNKKKKKSFIFLYNSALASLVCSSV